MHIGPSNKELPVPRGDCTQEGKVVHTTICTNIWHSASPLNNLSSSVSTPCFDHFLAGGKEVMCEGLFENTWPRVLCDVWVFLSRHNGDVGLFVAL